MTKRYTVDVEHLICESYVLEADDLADAEARARVLFKEQYPDLAIYSDSIWVDVDEDPIDEI